MTNKILYPLLSTVSFLFMTVVDTLFSIIYKNGQKSVSKLTDPILLMPAVTLAAKIRSRELKAEDVMASYITRAKDVNPLVNAITGEQYDKALRAAQNLDKALNLMTPEEIEKDPEYSSEKKPFLGVPLSVKESFSWTGMANTVGIVVRKHIRADSDAPVLSQMKEAGAIPFIQTNVSEACMWFESSNYVYGCTKNAYDTSRMVGGSSGGEGCIISAGASVLGIGSDIGGSIRMPAFFNGIFGHKPSIGIVDNFGQFPVKNDRARELLTTGPMCRYAVDLIPALKVMAKPGALDQLKLDTEVDISKVKVISVPDNAGALTTSAVDPQLKEVQKKVEAFLSTKGATVTERRFEGFQIAGHLWQRALQLCGSGGPAFSEKIGGLDGGPRVNCIKELLLSLVRMSEHTLPAIVLGIMEDYFSTPSHTVSGLKAKITLDKLSSEVQKVLGDDGVLLYPSHPKIAPYHNHPLFTPFNFAYTALFNAMGFPVTQCPLGLSKEGLPLGIQVVTSPNNDHLSLAVAQELEKGFGGWVSPGSK